jgi:predicted metalloprotease with PDZ domain
MLAMRRGGSRVTGPAAIALSLASCVPRAPAQEHPQYSYSIAPPPEGSWRLDVEATLEGAPSDRLVAADTDGVLREVDLIGPAGVAPLPRDGDAFIAPACRSRCTIRYSLDLEQVASSCHRMDCLRKIGDAMFGRASIFLVHPEPMGDGSFVVTMVGPNASRVATGLRPLAHDTFAFQASAFGEASYTAFGAFRRADFEVKPENTFHVVFLGPPLAMGDDAAATFIRQSADLVARLFDDRWSTDVTIFVVPVPGEQEVVFGRVLSLAGASVALLFGTDTPASGVRQNWVVVHELFHLECPSFVGEGRWLEEGLATYYEPILRERAGWMTEADLWTYFVREMPRGLRHAGDPPDLESRDDIDATYWGGALFALFADVRARAVTHGARSLDGVVRVVFFNHGGASSTARIADFLKYAEVATGTQVVTEVFDSWAVRGENVDLDALWAQLGVDGVEDARAHGATVTLRNDAPLAAVRRGISTTSRSY